MENKQRILKEKLKFLGIVKEAVKITCKNPYFIIFTCLTSLPLLFSLFMYESLFIQTLTEAAKVLHEEEAKSYKNCLFCSSSKALRVLDHLIDQVSHNFLLLILSHLGIIHLCDFFNTVAAVNSASVIHAGEKTLNLKEMFIEHVMDSRLKGPLITSIYTLLLTSILSVGLLSLLIYTFVMTASSFPLLVIVFLVMFVGLLRQYLEWGAVWELGTVVSILEEKEGDVALVIAAYLSRGNRGIGILLMICCVLWRLGLRILCLFVAMDGGVSKMLIIVIQVCLVGLANIIKWVSFVVYYVDCKKLILENGQGQGVSSL
ncbi:hypothetical protein VNO78_16249 [Psophocarpus tetragonolobus]|uniref:Transmembrane protein n=1 Tax=Psophocarpus tetragonolobus TaxID=3891 RepID=A0AAN9XKI1_PSOTE